jgi:hypothetical protein
MEYKFTATLKQDLEITIQADSYEEALRIADYETIIDDWDVIESEFNLEEYKPKSIKPEQLARIISILEDQNKGE